MIKTAKFLAGADINGKPVSFFTPPHDEPDFIWADIDELAQAFLPRDEALRMVQHSHAFGKGERVVATAPNGDRISTIVCNAMAQAFCQFIDIEQGEKGEYGPAHIAMLKAFADVQSQHLPLSLVEMVKASTNQGGPFMRGMRVE